MGVEYVCENMRTRLRFLFTKNKSHFCANGRKQGFMKKYPCRVGEGDLY